MAHTGTVFQIEGWNFVHLCKKVWASHLRTWIYFGLFLTPAQSQCTELLPNLCINKIYLSFFKILQSCSYKIGTGAAFSINSHTLEIPLWQMVWWVRVNWYSMAKEKCCIERNFYLLTTYAQTQLKIFTKSHSVPDSDWQIFRISSFPPPHTQKKRETWPYESSNSKELFNFCVIDYKSKKMKKFQIQEKIIPSRLK